MYVQSLIPCHTFSAASPDKPWAKGSLTPLTDDDVDKWLRQNAPQDAKLLKREAKAVADAQGIELSYHSFSIGGTQHTNGFRSNDSLLDYCDIVGEPLAPLYEAEKHWAFALYPGHGSVEICALVQPLLTQREASIFQKHFAEGKSIGEMEKEFALGRTTVCVSLKSVRTKLYKAAQAGLLPAPMPNDTGPDLEVADLEVADLLASSPITYRAPYQNRTKAKAYVCHCGHHMTLTNADLDHRRVVPGLDSTKSKRIPERQFRCPFCKRTYPESKWPDILA